MRAGHSSTRAGQGHRGRLRNTPMKASHHRPRPPSRRPRRLQCLLACGNRDPNPFNDPDRFDPEREDNQASRIRQRRPKVLLCSPPTNGDEIALLESHLTLRRPICRSCSRHHCANWPLVPGAATFWPVRSQGGPPLGSDRDRAGRHLKVVAPAVARRAGLLTTPEAPRRIRRR